MSTMTAQLLIGRAHPYDGGINPTYQMFLSENGVARWTLCELGLFSGSKNSNPVLAQWIPTIEHMLEDAIIMIGIYILKDENLIQMAKQYLKMNLEEPIVLYENSFEKGLELLRERARQLEHENKITLSIFYGSTIRKQITNLKNYKMDVEVCVPVYAKEYNFWTQSVQEKGVLE